MDTQQLDAVQPWIAPGKPIISLRGVTKSFGSHTVLEDITFRPRGHHVRRPEGSHHGDPGPLEHGQVGPS